MHGLSMVYQWHHEAQHDGEEHAGEEHAHTALSTPHTHHTIPPAALHRIYAKLHTSQHSIMLHCTHSTCCTAYTALHTQHIYVALHTQYMLHSTHMLHCTHTSTHSICYTAPIGGGVRPGHLEQPAHSMPCVPCVPGHLGQPAHSMPCVPCVPGHLGQPALPLLLAPSHEPLAWRPLASHALLCSETQTICSIEGSICSIARGVAGKCTKGVSSVIWNQRASVMQRALATFGIPPGSVCMSAPYLLHKWSTIGAKNCEALRCP